MAVPNIFATATSSIPLSQLDTNFATAITLGSTALYLGNTTTSVAGLTLTGSAFNGTVGATTPSTGVFTTLSASSTATLSGLTASTALALDASKNIVSVTNTGSGNNVLATSPTITGATLTTSIFNGTVGATTPSTGAFTTLSASSTVSAAGSTTIDSSGNLGVGATAPSTWGALAVRKAVAVLGRSVSGSFSDASTGTMEIAHASGYVALDTESGSTALRIAQAGTINGQFNQYGLGIGSGVPSSGMGITFPATQSASTDANTLDDYEEGTWTPSLGGTATYTSRTGSYTKIGRLVYVTVAMAINVIGTGSTFRISGLPFNAGVATGASGSVAYAAALSQNVVSFTVGVNAGDIDVYTMLAANTASSNNSIFGNTTTIQLSATYYV